jgi:serine/threonine protein phosphatase 1
MSQPTSRRIFIGDVHGHYDGLMALFDAIAPNSDDEVYFLGDLIDRGPQSSQVVDFVRNSPHQCLLGNHEQLLLEAFQNGEVYEPALQAWLYSGGRATVSSYKQVDLLMEHMHWMTTLPTYIDLDDIWLAHAGLHPGLPVEQQTPQELCWIREEFHSSPTAYFPDKLIITGHTITFTLPGVTPGEIAQGQGWLDIDTGAYHPRSGWLTGVDMTNQKVYQVNVFQQALRVLPLEEAVARVEPNRVVSHRQALRL